jgi:hypothetical protein
MSTKQDPHSDFFLKETFDPDFIPPAKFPHNDKRTDAHRAALVKWLGADFYQYSVIPSPAKGALPNFQPFFTFHIVSDDPNQGVSHTLKVYTAERFCAVVNTDHNGEVRVYIERFAEEDHKKNETETEVTAPSLEILTYLEMEICRIHKKPTFFAFNVDGVSVTPDKKMTTVLNEFLHDDYFCGADVFWSPLLLQPTENLKDLPSPPLTLNVLLFVVHRLQNSFGVGDDKVRLHSGSDGIFKGLQK